MTNVVRITPSPFIHFIPPNASKDVRSRLKAFIDWNGHGYALTQPDLVAYRDYLTIDRKLSTSSVKAHLSTIRGRYQALMRDNTFRDFLYAQTPADSSPADKAAYVNEILVRLQNAVHPSASVVKTITKQDVSDQQHLRLSIAEAQALLNAPGTHNLKAVRDTAILAMFLASGIREQELVDLDVGDLRNTLGGELALLVREGKGGKQRLVPYGGLSWCLVIVDTYLILAGISEGAVFRGFYKGGKRIRKTRIHKRAINQILNAYPIVINGEMNVVKPHDLRRTYARMQYMAGMDMLALKDNLGHASVQTTEHYIGTLDVSARLPDNVLKFDLDGLNDMR